MTDLTDAEIDDLAEHWRCAGPPCSGACDYAKIESLIAEVRRWRDKAADDAGLAQLAELHLHGYRLRDEWESSLMAAEKRAAAAEGELAEMRQQVRHLRAVIRDSC